MMRQENRLKNLIASDPRAARFWRHRDEPHYSFWTREYLTSPATIFTAIVAILVLIGFIMVFSASSIANEMARNDNLDAWTEFKSQLVFIVIATIIAAFLIHTHGTFWTSNTALLVLWIILVAMLVACFAFKSINGAQRWIRLFGMSLQPSEFAKVLLILICARLMGDWNNGLLSTKRLLVMTVIFVLIPFAIIAAQRDLGTLLIIALSLYCILILAEVRVSILIVLAVVAAALVIGLILSQSYRSSRIEMWLAPNLETYGLGQQIVHSEFAIASGGFWGVGLGNSTQKYAYLPEPHNDFIFAIIAEEFGFVGATFVILLFLGLGWCGYRMARSLREYDLVSSFAVSGLVLCILWQTFVNIASVTRLMPLTGRPLPFISAGGSSIMACMIMMGVIVAIMRDAEQSVIEGHISSNKWRRPSLRVVEGGASQKTGRSPEFSSE
ncbi:MAG: cell division protein FtsW [Coriobacteriales bacterium]|nr:cell division protein FtsW [Coriobacteriales bacterium]